jgi:hypothetical protein
MPEFEPAPMRLFVSLILAPVTAVLLADALLVAAPGPVPERILWLGLTLPLIWVGIMIQAYRAANIRRFAAAIGLLTGAGAPAGVSARGVNCAVSQTVWDGKTEVSISVVCSALAVIGISAMAAANIGIRMFSSLLFWGGAP